MHAKRLLTRFATATFALISLAAAVAHAQPGQPPNDVDASFRFSAKSDAEFHGATQGELETSTFSLGFDHARPVSEKLRVELGFRYEETLIDSTGPLPLPDSLRATEIELGATWSFTPAWSLTALVRPGFHSDDGSFNSDAFNVPAMLLARWQYSRSLTFFGGALYDSFSEDTFTPFFGLRWQASPRVAVTLGAPRTEISYDVREGHKIFAALSLHGGSYHLENSAASTLPAYSHLRDSEVSYREIHLGAGYAWSLTKNLTVEIEAGWLLDRRFDFYDRGLVVKTDGAPTARFSLNSRF